MYSDKDYSYIYVQKYAHMNKKYIWLTVLVFCDNLYCYAPSNRDFPTQDTFAKVKIVSC